MNRLIERLGWSVNRYRDGVDGDRQLILASGLFDAGFYRRHYRDVDRAGVDPVTHYLKAGAKEGRRPHPFFDGGWYLRANPDVAAAGRNPLVHYLRHGLHEGRRRQKRCVVYTAITHRYDDLRPPLVVDPDLDFVVFADDRLPAPPHPWVPIQISERHGEGCLASRYIKTHPHLLLSGYETSAWVDGAFQLRGLSADAMEAVGRAGPIAFFPHPLRDCAYEEASIVKASGLDSFANVDRIVEHLEANGFPRRAGLVETGFIIRDHKDVRVVTAMEEWWDMIRDRSARDQLSINYILWRHGLRHGVLPGNSRRNAWAYWMGHRPATLEAALDRLAWQEQELLDSQTRIETMRGPTAEPLSRSSRQIQKPHDE